MNQNYDGVDINNKYYKFINPNKFQQKYINKKYDNLTAISPVFILNKENSNNNGYNSWWLFECSCGNKICRRFKTINNSKNVTFNCGCKKQEQLENNYLGKTYGYLTVISLNNEYKKEHNIKSKNSYYKCQCKCGNYTTVRINALTSGEIKSCGCLKKEQEKKNLVHGITLIDLTGKKFGLLKVIKRDTNIEDSNDPRWLCQCECGTIKSIRGSCLRSESTISCGCLHMSAGEYKIFQILKENNISFLYDSNYFPTLKTINNRKGRYDFIILDNDNNPIRLIEFDGKQHYEPIPYFGGEEQLKIQKINDEIKNQFAKENNLPLIRIPYYCINEISYENLFNDKFLIK